MKKVGFTALFFFAFAISVSTIYCLLLPERSEEILSKEIADTSELKFIRNELDHFNAANEKNIAQTLSAIHQSELINLSVINSAVNEFGATSREAFNAIALKEYQDSLNLLKATAIINKYGWPGPERIGAQNNYTLFTTIQNADLQTQGKYLPEMEKAVRNGTLSPNLFAKLVDRKSLAEYGYQIFGTHYTKDEKNGIIILSPLIDKENLNKRRKEIGLFPINTQGSKVDLLEIES